MEILVWIVIGLLVSGEVYYYLYRKRIEQREQKLKDFILGDDRLRQLYLEFNKQKPKSASQ